MTLRGRLVVGIAPAAMLIILGLMPLILLLVPEPEAVRIADLAGERSGAYLDASEGLFKLYPYASLATGFPKAAPVIGGDPIFLIKYRALEAKSSYGIFAYYGSLVPTVKTVKTGKIMRITPKTALTPGRYYLKIAKDSMYGGSQYFFFQASIKGKSVGRFNHKEDG